jgi:predicted Zn finger-like uncharacterized protein
LITIGCPQCKASYRIDATKIPPAGGVITCRTCQTKIPIKPEAPEFEEIEELSPDAEVADDAPAAPQESATVAQLSPFLTEAPAYIPSAPPTLPAVPPVVPIPPPKEAAVTLPATSSAPPPPPPPKPNIHTQSFRRVSGPLTPEEVRDAPELKAGFPEPKAHGAARPAAEVAPGSSLYECPHCHKPFYIKEAKKLAAKKTADAGAEKDTRKAILVVDDQEFFRTFTRDLLGRSYRVMEADSIASAREQIAHCDLLILDLNLGGEDGRQLLSLKPPGAKCLIFCGQDDNLVEPAAFKKLQGEGADDLLFKSIAASDELKHKVAALMGDLPKEKAGIKTLDDTE